MLGTEFVNFNSREDQACINKNYFKCWQGTGCISLRAVCDGVKDCADGSDERVCDNWSSHCDQYTEFRVKAKLKIYIYICQQIIFIYFFSV